jgi:hypothetical protein
MKIPLVCGERTALCSLPDGEVDLMFVGGKWYLAVVCDVQRSRKDCCRRRSA